MELPPGFNLDHHQLSAPLHHIASGEDKSSSSPARCLLKAASSEQDQEYTDGNNDVDRRYISNVCRDRRTRPITVDAIKTSSCEHLATPKTRGSSRRTSKKLDKQKSDSSHAQHGVHDMPITSNFYVTLRRRHSGKAGPSSMEAPVWFTLKSQTCRIWCPQKLFSKKSFYFFTEENTFFCGTIFYRFGSSE
jgi:hypothetical protein